MYFDAKTCGKRIQLLRSKKNLTRLQLSFKLNVSERHLGSIERGERIASLDIMIEMADFFDVTLDYLIVGKSEDPRKTRLFRELESLERHIETMKSLI